MKILFVTIILFFSHFVFAAISKLTVQGVVVSYNKNKVVLAQDNGKKVKVPRSSIPKFYKLKTGKRVHATLDSKKLLDLLRKQEERKKKKKKVKKEAKTRGKKRKKK